MIEILTIAVASTIFFLILQEEVTEKQPIARLVYRIYGKRAMRAQKRMK